MMLCAILPLGITLISTLSQPEESEEPSVGLCGAISLRLWMLEKHWSTGRKKKEGIDTSWHDLPGHTIMYHRMRCTPTCMPPALAVNDNASVNN